MEGRFDRLPSLAAELVRLKVDILVTASTPAAQAGQQATQSIPIVLTNVSDPVESGLVSSLARPGGNVTGLSLMHPDFAGKRLELLKEVFPSSRGWPSSPSANPIMPPLLQRDIGRCPSLGCTSSSLSRCETPPTSIARF